MENERPVEDSSVDRTRSSTRLRYAAEVAVFRRQHGSMEDIRQRLGLSRRKICHLLMVDPSAWTRWVKDEGKVPPHVYKLLEFYLADRGPGISGPLDNLKWQQNSTQLAEIRWELKKQRTINIYLLTALALVVCVIGFLSLHR